MSIESAGTGVPDHGPCCYGASRLQFRGPKRQLNRPYVAFLGGTETYGRFVEIPFVDLIEQSLLQPCANLGCTNAGLDAFGQDPDILRIAQRAELCVLQVLGAQNLTNRYYRVHPRRNDRFLQPTPDLAMLFPEVDFTEFHFNKHLLSALQRRGKRRFVTIRDELQGNWLARMKGLVRTIGKPVVLVWLRYDFGGAGQSMTDLGGEPALIERWMLDALSGPNVRTVEVKVKTAGQSGDLADMIFGALQLPTAEHLIGPGAHRAVARALLPVLRDHRN